MKNLILLVGLVLIVIGFSGCGKKTEQVLVEKAQDFEGFYLCGDHSSVELLVDVHGRVSFDTTGQSLNSVNPVNGTLGTHPTISERDLLVSKQQLIIAPRNYTYSSSTHDLEEDVGGSNVTGSKRTDVVVKRTGEDSISILIKIFKNANNSNINEVVVQRSFDCAK